MDGVLGFGRPLASRPTALKVWVKYTPGEVKWSSTDLLPKGEMDRGSIFVALTDASRQSDGSEQWPVIIRTKSSDRKLFDKNGSNIIAYGEKIFTEATAGEGMVEITIPLDYRKTDVCASDIVITCSASQYGDYFTGGESVMYVDDFELVYE